MNKRLLNPEILEAEQYRKVKFRATFTLTCSKMMIKVIFLDLGRGGGLITIWHDFSSVLMLSINILDNDNCVLQ